MADGVGLEFKPDLATAQERWLAFWAGELIDRPCCVMTAPRDGMTVPGGPPYLSGAKGDWQPVIDTVLARTEAIYWAGEAIPHYVPSFGPDQMAAFCGAELVIPDEGAHYGTDWALPCITDWETDLPITLDPDNYWWQRMLGFMDALAEAFSGKLVLSHLDLHSNLDTLLAMAGGEKLCLDLILEPDSIDRAMADVRALYAPIYDGAYEAGRMHEHGTLGWVPAYHPVKANTIQCDFAALIGPEHFRRWALPALTEEAEHLGGACIYHLDGPECIVHVDDLCTIPKLRGIQWTTGARNKGFPEWMDLLKHIQSKGKALWVPCNCDSIKMFHQELDPANVFYVCGAPSQTVADETLQWLVEHT